MTFWLGVATLFVIAFAGGIDVPVVLNSRSTHLRSGFGGLEGRSLQPGDVLRVLPGHEAPTKALGVMSPGLAIPGPPADPDETAMVLRVVRAGEYDIFPADMQERFWQTRWKISHQSDRAGYRLSGPPLELPAPAVDGISSWHLYIIRLHDSTTRLRVFEALRASGIGVNVHYIPIHTQPDYQALGFDWGMFPQSEKFYSEIISLPLYAGLTDDDVHTVVAAVKASLAG